MKQKLHLLPSRLLGWMMAVLMVLLGTTAQAQTVTVAGSPATNGSFSTSASVSGYYTTWTSNSTSGVAGLTITTGGNLGMKNQYVNTTYGTVLALKTNSMQTQESFTITAPSGYVILSYSMTARLYSSANDAYRVYNSAGGYYTVTTGGNTISESGFSASSVALQVMDNKSSSAVSSNYLCITALTVELGKLYTGTATAAEVYAIAGARGGLTYDPDYSKKWVWSSGANAGHSTYSTSNANCQWILYPTGTSGQYYLYNVGAKKFAVPTTGGSYNGESWKFSDDAAAVTLTAQVDGTYKIKAPYGDRFLAFSNGYIGPIINYDDSGAQVKLYKVADASSTVSSQLSTAIGRLIDNRTKVSALSEFTTAGGFYVLHIKEGDWTGHSPYPVEGGRTYNGTNYPLDFYGYGYDRASIANGDHIFRIAKTAQYYTWQMSDGHYLCALNNKFPQTTMTPTEIVVEKPGTYFNLKSANYYAIAYNNASTGHFLGETTTQPSNGLYEIYPVDLAAAGLNAWQVTINHAGDNTYLTCTRDDVSGPDKVYNGGWFFLPSDVTPTSSDFYLGGMGECNINSTAKTITVSFDATIAMTADNVSVEQGWQSAGRDDKVYLLRINASPFRDATGTSLTVSLKDGTESQISSLTLYEANSSSPEVLGTGSGSATLTQVATTAIDGSSTTATLSIGALSAGDHYYWLAAQVKSDATLGAVLDAAATSVSYQVTGQEAQTLDLTSVGDPSDRGAMVFNTRSYPFLPWDEGSHVYRIPAMVVANDGSIVVACDKRYNRTDDIGNSHVIDIVIRRSTDGGKTWSSPVVVAKGDNSSDATCGYGDPSLYKDNNGKLYCLFAAGNTGYFKGLNRICMTTSTDNGVTWSSSASNPPADLVSTGKVTDHANAYGSNTAYGLYDYFVTSGRGICTSEGYLMALLPAQAYTTSAKSSSAITSNSQDYIFYSTDRGATWHISENAIFTGGDEAKVTQLKAGKIMASVRQGYNRGFNTATYTYNGDGTLSFTMGTQWNNSQLSAGGAANNQDILYYQREAAAHKTDVIFHSMTTGSHANLKLYYSTDQGNNWTEFLNVQTKGARYVTLDKGGTEANPGSLYLFFEDQSLNAAGGDATYNHYPLNFIEITREQLLQYIPTLDYDDDTEAVKVADGTNTNGPDTYGDAGTGGKDNLGNATSTWTSNATSGLAGVTITSDHNAFLSTTDYDSYKCLAIIPSGTTAETYTITAPEGYLIKGYKLVAGYRTDKELYTFTASEGLGTTTGTTTASPSNTTAPQIEVTGIDKASTTFTMTAAGTTRFACVKEFYVYLVEDVQEPFAAPTGFVTLRDDRQKRFLYADTDGYLRTSRTINHANVSSASWQFVERTAGSGQYDIVNQDGKYIDPATYSTSLTGENANPYLKTTTTQPAGYWTLSESTKDGCTGAFTLYSSTASKTLRVLDYDNSTYPAIGYGSEGNTEAGCQIFAEAVRTLPVISDDNSSTYYTIVSERVDAYDSSVSRASLKSPDVGANFVGVALDNTDINQQWKFTANSNGGYNVVSAGFAQYINGDAAAESGAKMSLTDAEPASGWTLGYNWEGLYSISNGTQQLHVGGYNDSYQVLNWGGGTNFSDIGCKLHIEAAPAPVFNLTSGWYQIKVNNNPEYNLGSDESTTISSTGHTYTYTQGRVNIGKNSLRSRYVLNDEQWAFFQAQEGATGNGKPESFVPLRLQSAAEKAMPADDDATYYIYVNVDESNNVQLRSSNGHWVGQSGFANYQTPMQTTSGEDSSFFTTNALHQFDSDGYGLGTKNLNGEDAYMTVWPSVVSDTYTDLIGETHNSTENMLYMNAGTTAVGDGNFNQTRYLLRKVNPADQGLTEWKVRTGVYPEDQVELTANLEYTYQHEAPHVTLTGVDAANVSGVTTAYLGGTFFMKNNTALTDDNLEAARATNYWDGIQRVKVVALADDGENQIMMFETYVGIIYAQAKEASDGVGIGYPKADHEARVALAATGVDFTTDVNAVTTSSFTDDQITDMIVYSELLLTESDITKLQMPEEGKAYTFRLVKKDGTKGNYLKNATLGSDLTGTSQLSIAAVPESGIPEDGWFIGKKISDGTYAFVNIAGDYVTYINKDGSQNGVYGTTGAGSTYEVAVDGYGTQNAHLTLSKFPYEGSYITSTKPKDTYGLFMLSGYRKSKANDCPILVKEDGLTFDNSDVPFYNGSYTSAFLCEEANPFLNQNRRFNDDGEGNALTTLYLPFPVTLPDGMEAYTGTVNLETRQFELSDTPITGTLPRQTAAVIKVADTFADKSSYTFIPSIEAVDAVTGNALQGTLVNLDNVAYDWESASKGELVDAYYVLSRLSEGVGFGLFTGSYLEPGKAYLHITTSDPVRGFAISFNGANTGIDMPETATDADEAAATYDLQGRRVANTKQKKNGVYIVGGKKVLF